MQSTSRLLRWSIALTLVLVFLSMVTSSTASPVMVVGETSISEDNTTLKIDVSYLPRPEPNTNLSVFVDAKNAGNHTATLPVTLYRNGTAVDNGSITIAPSDYNGTELVTHIGTRNATISVNQYNYSSPADLFGRVLPQEDLLSHYDTDNSSRIETGELLIAIEDWKNDKITTANLLSVLDAWQSNKSV